MYARQTYWRGIRNKTGKERIITTFSTRGQLNKHCLFWRQLTTKVTEHILFESLLQFEIVTPVTVALMQRTANYFTTFTPKCFELAVAAVGAKLRAILLNRICKILLLLCRFVNSAHDGQFRACWPILQSVRENLVVGAREEVLKDVGMCNDRMFAHAINPRLQLP